MILHPSSVHFPIALLMVSGLCYLFSFLKRNAFAFDVGSFLHSVGIIGVLIAILTGKLASSSLSLAPQVASLIWQHEIMAYGILWSFGMLWLWQYMRKKALKSEIGYWERICYIAIFWCAIGFMSYSSYIGGIMVYEYGVGVNMSP